MTPQHSVIVYVIDDDPEICRSLAMLLHAEGIDVRTFDSVEAFLACTDRLGLGVVVTDVRMPGMDGLALITALRAKDRLDPVIVITGHAEVTLAVQALKAGASDFIEKPFGVETITEAIRTCAASPVLRAADLLATLTRRERDVLDQLLDGASNKQIANNLGISPRTVEIYRAHLMDKMKVPTLSQLVRIGILAGLAQNPSAS